MIEGGISGRRCGVRGRFVGVGGFGFGQSVWCKVLDPIVVEVDIEYDYLMTTTSLGFDDLLFVKVLNELFDVLP